MSEWWKMDVELLQCPPQVNSTLFPKALNNRIAQDYGKYTYIQQTSWLNKINTIYIFLSNKSFQVTSRFKHILVEYS